jgi:Ca2+-binding EF-hand superfamily protein
LSVEDTKNLVTSKHKRCAIENMENVFKKLDTSGDGKIDRHEMEAGLKEIGVDIDHSVIDKMMDELDQDGDGVLDFGKIVFF